MKIEKLREIAICFSELSNARQEAYEAKLELIHTKEILNNLTTRMAAQQVARAEPRKEKVKNK